MLVRSWSAALAAMSFFAFEASPVRAQSDQPPEPAQTSGDGETTTLPPVVVVTTEEQPPAATQSSSTTSGTATAVSPAPEPVAIDQSVIFGAPAADGDTLDRGTTGVDGYFAAGTSVATKTSTSLMDVPGSVTVLTKGLVDDQGVTLLGEALRYVPGIAVQQGEGHRDQITLRGQETTADFFVDGVRDDIQTFRDLYNAETVEVLKGPMAMIFGRGGGGGVINRVTKRADGVPVSEGSIQFGQYGRKRVTADVGQAVTSDFAVRLNAMYEDSENFRDYFWLERYGINPTVGIKLAPKTTLHLSYEYKVHDQTVDRGGPSLNGRPFSYPSDTYFGQPNASFTTFDGHIATATFQHETASGIQFRNHTFFADYDKLYQNIFADSAVDPGTGDLDLSGYQSLTERQNFVNQSDVSYAFNTGAAIGHTIVAGTEIAIQNNNEFRNTPSFGTPNSGVGTITVSAANPTSFEDVFFDQVNRQRFTDLQTTSAFIQDQIEITPYFEVIGGVRFERFDIDFDNPLSGFSTSRVDNVWSPRVGAVVKPTETFHVYASYSKSFLPQNGDNFGQLDVDGATLEPEQFINYETGFKWRVAPRLMVTGAIYQLDRENQRVTVGTEEVASGETRTRGAEVEISGYVTETWEVFGGYALTDSEILFAGDDASGLALVGNSVESVPLHSVSLWNKYQINKAWGVALGVIHQSSWFAEANNDVTVPGYTRFDGAVYVDLDDNWSAQLNVENLLDNTYWVSSHNNDNISYGAPRSAYVTIRAAY
jgi:catecholate siderophore receptor